MKRKTWLFFLLGICISATNINAQVKPSLWKKTKTIRISENEYIKVVRTKDYYSERTYKNDTLNGISRTVYFRNIKTFSVYEKIKNYRNGKLHGAVTENIDNHEIRVVKTTYYNNGTEYAYKYVGYDKKYPYLILEDSALGECDYDLSRQFTKSTGLILSKYYNDSFVSFYTRGDFYKQVEIETDSLTIWKQYYKNGQLALSGQWYKGGEPTFSYQFYFGNHVAVDTFWQYYENGQLKQAEVYDTGRLHGIMRSWYDDGNLYEVVKYDKGRDTAYIAYFPNGNVKEIATNRYSIPYYHKKFYEDGFLKSHFFEDSTGDYYKEWYPTGELYEEYFYIDCKNGYETCNYRFVFSLDGELIYKYSKDLNGKYEIFYYVNNGKIARKYEYLYRNYKTEEKFWSPKGYRISRKRYYKKFIDPIYESQNQEKISYFPNIYWGQFGIQITHMQTHK